MLKLYYFGCQLSKAKKQFILTLRQINKMGNASSWCNYGRPQSKDKDDFEAVQNEVLIGGEPLGEVNGEQMKKRLHKHQAVIICRYKNLKLWGSGVSISKDLVLTSAHNFFIGDELMDKVDYFIYPGHAGSLKKAFKIDKFYVNDQYKNAQGKETIKFDYALIKLTEKLDTTADFIRLKVLTDYDTKTQLGVFGYPQKEYKSEISEEKYYVNQWGKRKVNAIVDVRRQNGEIRHSVSTLPGQSGSPIIEINKQQVNIVGIHKGGIRYKLNGKSQWSNVGRLITKELVDQLKQKAKQMGAQMFKIWSRDSKSQMNLSVLPFYPAQYASPPKISSQDKKKALLLFRAGQDLYFKNDYPKANAKFIDSITLNPKSAAVCFHLGLTYDHTQHYDVAIEWYKKAKEIDPGNASYLKVLASALQKNEQYGPAADIYRQILSKNQHDQPALMSLAHALYKSKNIVQAISIYKKITESNPWYFQAHYGLGCANMAVKQYSLALKSFEKCAQIKSNDQKTKKKMGQIQAKLKQNEQI